MPVERGAVRLSLGDGTLPPVPCRITAAGGEVVSASTETLVEVPVGALEVAGDWPTPWRAQLQLAPGARELLTLRASVCLLLADAGGRELGGLPVEASLLPPDGPPVPLPPGRVGYPLVLPPGRVQLRLPLDPPWSRTLDLAVGEERKLDLGRLVSLLVHWRRPDGVVTAGTPLWLEAEGGHRVPSAVGQERHLWPGRWTVSLADTTLGELPPRVVEAAGGALTEVELGLGGNTRRAHVLVDEVRGALRTVRRNLGLHTAQPIRPRGEPEGILRLRDGHGGLVRRRIRVEGPVSRTLWSGAPNSLPPGRYSVVLVERPDLPWTCDLSAGPDLGALGTLMVVLKDPEGLSLRWAPLEVIPAAGGAPLGGRLGLPVELPPGRYHLHLPTLPGWEREVEVRGGVVTEVDLGVSGQVLVEPSLERPPGAPVWLWAEAAGADRAPLAHTRVGAEQLLPEGTYTAGLLAAEGPREPVEARRRRKRWPSVALRVVGADR